MTTLPNDARASSSTMRPMIELLHIRDLGGEEVIEIAKNMVRQLLTDKQLTFRRFSAQPVLVDGIMRHRLENAGSRGNAKLPLHSVKLAQVIAIMQIITAAWRSDRWFTLRDIYYHLKGSVVTFETQVQSNSVVHDLQLAHAASLTSFRVKAAARGSFAGQVSFKVGREGLWSSTSNPFENQVINPGDVHQMEFQHMDGRQRARAVVVLEKDSVYQQLIDSRFFERFPCIIITGRGVPCMATRIFLRRVVDQLDLDVFGLCDWNPHGLAIMLTYMCGSVSNPESYRYAVKRLRVAGLFYADLVQQDDAGLSRCLVDQTYNDKGFLTAMLKWRVLELHPYLRDELLEMQRTGLKAELQAINQCGDDAEVDHISQSWVLAAIVRAATSH